MLDVLMYMIFSALYPVTDKLVRQHLRVAAVSTHQRLPVLSDEVLSGRRPARQQHVVHRVLRELQTAQVKPCRRTHTRTTATFQRFETNA